MDLYEIRPKRTGQGVELTRLVGSNGLLLFQCVRDAASHARWQAEQMGGGILRVPLHALGDDFEFKPIALSEEEVDEIVNTAITQTNAGSIKDMGKVMGLVRPQIIGRADMGEVSGRIKSILSAS